MEIVHTDVLIVGGGAAGARAALEAARAGARTHLVTKGTFGRSGTSTFPVSDVGGFGAAGFVDPEDSPEVHFNDIMEAAQGMCDPQMARIVATEAPVHLLFLESIGVPFQRHQDTYLATQSCFSSRARSIKVKGHGRPIVACLRRQILKEKNIQVLENAMVLDPLTDLKNRCVGATVLQDLDRVLEVRAKATILATGGAGQLFERSFNPPDVTGDGYAFGLLAGAELINMEFMQSGFGIISPTEKNFIFQYWLWGLNPELTTAKGEDFLSIYAPPNHSTVELMEAKSKHFPFSTRDCSKFMEISVQLYINDRQRVDQDEAVWMRLVDIDKQLSQLPPEHNLRRMWPISKTYLKSIGVDFDKPFRIACFAHAMSGGLRIDPFGRTGVEGLYAAGETAGGPHGADRLGGNMFTTTQVFGRRAALHAAHYSRQRSDVTDDQILPTKKPAVGTDDATGISGPAIRSKLQRVASRSLLIVREDSKLADFIHETEKMEADLDRLSPEAPNPLRTKYELRNLMLTGKAMAMAARIRNESRGSHYRKDFPEPDDEWNGKILVSSMSDGHKLQCRELTSNPDTP
jgi:succinate dehydrogenase/fumarate reductase flavoprotein subunit